MGEMVSKDHWTVRNNTLLSVNKVNMTSPHDQESKFYAKRIIQKQLSTNKLPEKYYPEELFIKYFIQTHLTYLSFNMTYST